MSNLDINWDDALKKEARGIGDYDLGEVDEVQSDVIVTKKGIVDKDKFYLPKHLAQRYEDKVWFKISKDDAQTFRRD